MKGTLQEMKAYMQSFTKLEHGWNGYNALPIEQNVVDIAIVILEKTSQYLPEVFPTGRGTIQFEYYYGNHFAEIEIGIECSYLVGLEEDRVSWVEKDIPVSLLPDFINDMNCKWRDTEVKSKH